MEKYLVIANTYDYAYGVIYHLFAICNTEEEAIQWVLNHPIVHIPENTQYDIKEHTFSFLKYFNQTNITKEEYIKICYINKFTEDTPMFIGDYIE